MAKKNVKVVDLSKPVRLGKPYYKVLKPNGLDSKGNQLLSGGYSNLNYAPNLPTSDGKPGKPLSVSGQIVMCQRGLHVTSEPNQWGAGVAGNRVFTVKVFGQIKRDGSDKICCQKIQLVQEVHSVGGKWVPKAPNKTYTKQEVDKIVSDVYNKATAALTKALQEVRQALR